MNEPKRWLQDPNAPSGIQDLLLELEPAQPPSAEKEAALVGQLLSSASPPVPPPSVAPWLATGAFIVGGVGALLGLIAAPTPMLRPAEPVASTPSPRVREEIVAPPETSSAPVKTPTVSPPSPPPPPRDTLAEEEALLERARQAVAASPAAALGLLQEHRRRFPMGQLTAERMFLSVQVLRRQGDGAAAAREAQSLIRRFPSSVYAAELRRDRSLSDGLR